MYTRITSLLLAPLLVCACDDDKADSAVQPGDSAVPEDTAPPTAFESGTYRISLMEIEASEVGYDLDGDGEIDNELPDVLMVLNMAVSGEDLSREGLNATIAESVTNDELVLLADASYSSLTLTYDLLLGLVAKDGSLAVDEEQSYEGGEPKSRFTGTFSDETTISLTAGSAQIPVTFYANEPALEIPLEQALAVGGLDDAQTAALLGGAIPVDMLMEQVVTPMIARTAKTKEEKADLVDLAETVLSNKNYADIDLGGGRRGISAALSYSAEAASW